MCRLQKCPNMDAGLARSLGYSFSNSPGMSELTMDSERVAGSPSTPSRDSPIALRVTPGTTPCYPVQQALSFYSIHLYLYTKLFFYFTIFFFFSF